MKSERSFVVVLMKIDVMALDCFLSERLILFAVFASLTLYVHNPTDSSQPQYFRLSVDYLVTKIRSCLGLV